MDTLHKILQIMWDKGMGEKELCQLAGINKSAVTDWKKGKTQSYTKHLPEIAKALGVKEEELLGENDIAAFDTSVDLSEQERLIIEKYRSASTEDKFKIIAAIVSITDV